MIKKLTYLTIMPAAMLLASCATSNQTAQRADQFDDVYYSVAEAREQPEVIAQDKPENKTKNYVTDEELYGDAEGGGYYDDYASRINRFRNYAPWRGYYHDVYTGYSAFNNFYDPFYSPYGMWGGTGMNVSIGWGSPMFYNPWRFYGSNYYGNFWGPYSYYNPWNPYGYGFGGGFYGGGFYGGVGGGYVSPNYRPRPGRSSNNPMVDRMGMPAGVTVNPNNGVPARPTRAERYNGGQSNTPNSGRPQSTAPRPARVNQAQPERRAQPERIYRAPSNDAGRSNNGGGNSGGGRSNDSGGGGGARPSRGN